MLAMVAVMARGEDVSRDVLREAKTTARRGGASAKTGAMKKAYTLDSHLRIAAKGERRPQGKASQEGRNPRSDSRPRAAHRSRRDRPGVAGAIREGEAEEVSAFRPLAMSEENEDFLRRCIGEEETGRVAGGRVRACRGAGRRVTGRRIRGARLPHTRSKKLLNAEAREGDPAE